MINRFFLAAFLGFLPASFVFAQVPAVKPPAANPPAAGAPLATMEQQASYSIGLDFARRLKADEAPLDTEALVRGIRAGLSDGKPELTDDQMNAVMQKFLVALRAKRAEGTKREGAAFLAENAKKPGVKQTASGLQYKVLKQGTGASPKATDTVQVHYTGKFLNGEPFDTSVGGEPIKFAANKVIPGWTEALQLMRVGDKWELFIPSDLAYGDTGNQRIPPGTLLHFEVELLDIVK